MCDLRTLNERPIPQPKCRKGNRKIQDGGMIDYLQSFPSSQQTPQGRAN